MAHERQPYYKHYPADWRGDANLRLCGLAARGLWTECLGLMHEASPRGVLLLSVDQLAMVVSRPVREVRAALAELEANGVSSRDAEGRLYSRRMVRDTAKSETAITNGKKGGHPSLVNQGHGSLVNQAHQEIADGLVNQTLGTERSTSSRSRSKPAKNNDPSGLIQARFERFWEAYPSHERRKDALKIFAKLNPDHELLAKMLDAIKRWKLTRRWRDGFVPHPTAWLNQGRWDDEVPALEGAPAPAFRSHERVDPPPPPAAEVLAKMGLRA
jgi:hypothetical protein